jgi:hypothetical protein
LRAISFRDLKLALPQFKNEVEMLHPYNDVAMLGALEAIGFDIKQPINYEASYHRDMQQSAAVGFRAVGEYNLDPKYKNFLDVMDRIIVVGLTDPTFAKELNELHGKSYTYRNDDEYTGKLPRKKPNDPRYFTEQELLDMGYTGDEDEPEYEEYLSASEKRAEAEKTETLTKQIAELENVRIMLRGE